MIERRKIRRTLYVYISVVPKLFWSWNPKICYQWSRNPEFFLYNDSSKLISDIK